MPQAKQEQKNKGNEDDDDDDDKESGEISPPRNEAVSNSAIDPSGLDENSKQTRGDDDDDHLMDHVMEMKDKKGQQQYKSPAGF